MLMLGPLIVGYAAYSLIFEKHKGWYSWALQVCIVSFMLYVSSPPPPVFVYQSDVNIGCVVN
jgi:hypothetical protein